jgi:hypothetical protein
VVAFSLAILGLVAMGLKQGRAQATENQGGGKFSGLVGQTVSVEQVDPAPVTSSPGFSREIAQHDVRILRGGRHIFRFDTFGDETWWGDTLHLHQAIEGAKLGGVGPGVSPNVALAVGLKVDLDALPASVIQAIRQGKFDLNDPANTLALLRLNSVVGLTGFFSEQGTLRSVGIQCPLPFHCRQLLCSRDWPSFGRVGEPRPQRRRYCGPCA